MVSLIATIRKYMGIFAFLELLMGSVYQSMSRRYNRR
jgi:hypothetical protein